MEAEESGRCNYGGKSESHSVRGTRSSVAGYRAVRREPQTSDAGGV